MINNKTWMVIALVVIFAGGLYFLSANSVKIDLVDSEEFESLVDEGIFTLQVHMPYYGEIEGTDLIIEDWENVELYLNELPEKDEPIAIYCRSGRMSGIVADKLAKLGYEKVYDLEGGMNAWQETGREIIIQTR